MKKLCQISLFIGSLLIFLGGNLVLAKAQNSRVETVTCQTTYQGKKYQKQALVYLPANYDLKKRHDIVYLLHGSTDSARGFYRTGKFKQELDRLLQTKKLPPTLVVFPTYYPDKSFVTSDYVADDPLNRHFADHELLSELVPAVEGKYKTYAKDTSKKQLQASRAHRAFGGFSMGAITTWYVFEKQLPYFKTFLPVAGDSWTIAPDGGTSAATQTARKLARSASSEFTILAGGGANDGTTSAMRARLQAMWQTKTFDRQNTRFYEVKGEGHTVTAMVKTFKHYATQIFD